MSPENENNDANDDNDVSPKPESPLDNYEVEQIPYNVKKTYLPPDKVKELVDNLDTKSEEGILSTDLFDGIVKLIGIVL